MPAKKKETQNKKKAGKAVSDSKKSTRKQKPAAGIKKKTALIDITARKQSEVNVVSELKEWQLTFDATDDVIWFLDPDHRILKSNKKAEQLFQRDQSEIIGKYCWEIVHNTAEVIPEYPVNRMKNSLKRESLDLQIGTGWFQVTVDPILSETGELSGSVHIIRDITELKKSAYEKKINEIPLDTLLQLSELSTEDDLIISDYIVNQAVAMTESKLGFFGFISEDETEMSFCSLPKDSLTECKIGKESFILSIENSGLWAEPVRQKKPILVNNYNDISPFKRGLPEGHVQIRNYLSVPALDNNRVVALLAVSNKKNPYTESDIKQLQLLVDGMWRIKQHQINEDKIKRQQFALNKSQELGQVGTWVFDFGRNLIALTDENCRILGVPYGTLVTYELLIGKVHPDDREYVNREWNAALEGKFFDIVHRLVIDGKIKWVRQKADLELDEKGRLQKLIGFTQDITELKTREETLIKSEEKYRELVQNANSIILRWRPDGSITFFNEFAQKFFGFDKSEIVGKNVIGSIVPETESTGRDLNKMVFDILKKPEKYEQNENENICKDGKRVWVSWTNRVILDRNGDVLEILSVGTDIIERKQAEEKMQESEARYRTLIEYAPEAIALLDTDNGSPFVDFNERAMQLFGLEPEMFLIVGPLELSPLKQPNGCLSRDFAMEKKKLALEGKNPVFEWMHRNMAGKDIPCEVRLVRLPTKDRDLFCACILDITERKQVEEKIHQLNLELENKVVERTLEIKSAYTELESFAYSVSHDLRAPLRHLSGFSQMLEDNLTEKLDEKGQHYLDVIKEEAERMSCLIDNLLDFSRTGRIKLSRQNVDLAIMVCEIINNFSDEMKERGIVCRIGELPEVSGDPNLLKQVFTNLINNAFKFTRHKSRPEIDIETVESSINEITIKVQDNGAGFNMKYKDKLFGVFQRLHSEVEFEGTGIGLANVKRIVERHSGRVWAEGEIGKGAIFYVSLPFLENKPDGRIGDE